MVRSGSLGTALKPLGSCAFSRPLCSSGDQEDQVEIGHKVTEHLAEPLKAPQVTWSSATQPMFLGKSPPSSL